MIRKTERDFTLPRPISQEYIFITGLGIFGVEINNALQEDKY